MTPNEHFKENVINLLNSVELTLTQKNADYATEADPFKNIKGSVVFGVTPQKAILTRMLEKLIRLDNVLDNGGVNMVPNETYIDTIEDIVGYACLLYAYEKRKEPLPETEEVKTENVNQHDVTIQAETQSFPKYIAETFKRHVLGS